MFRFIKILLSIIINRLAGRNPGFGVSVLEVLCLPVWFADLFWGGSC